MAVDVTVVEDKPKKQSKKAKAAVTEEVVVAEAPKEKTKPAKKSKKTEAAPVVEEAVVEVAVEAPAKKSKKAKASKKQEPEPVEEIEEVAAVADVADGDVEEDDQTAALLAGFESDDDSENDPEEDEDFNEDALVPTLSKKQRTALEKAAKGPKSNEPGVVFVGYVH
jgi:nucleolar protein 15